MTRLAKNEFYFNRYCGLEEVDTALASITLDDIVSVANSVFAQPMSSVVLGPIEGKEL